jgi:hypothetical protein
LLELIVIAMLLDAVFDTVFDIERFIGLSRILRGDWHDSCWAQGSC